jgi:hypothetical protein
LRVKWGDPDDKTFVLYKYAIGAWTIPGFPIGESYAPLGVEGGIARSTQNMQKLADLLAKNGIPLTIVGLCSSLTKIETADMLQWQEFCAKNCKEFINLFPAFFAEKDAHPDWYERLFNRVDVHFSAGGNMYHFGRSQDTCCKRSSWSSN